MCQVTRISPWNRAIPLGGAIFGARDNRGANPVAKPGTPQVVAATIYNCLKHLLGNVLSRPAGRPDRGLRQQNDFAYTRLWES
jgi:hypothetical protein